MNLHSSLLVELRAKAYREAYVESQIRMGLPFQVRALRMAEGWTQEDLANHAGMSQPRIAEIEKPRARRFNLETLLRIASAFDVGLEVRFVPISEIVDHNETFDPDAFCVPSFAEEVEQAERDEAAKAQRERLSKDTQERLRRVTSSRNQIDHPGTTGAIPNPRQGDLIRKANLRLAVTNDKQKGSASQIPPTTNIGAQEQLKSA